jgi:antitoxin component of MazEF toxin-antitoxin module
MRDIMEKRIFKFGNSSLALIVPKKWAVKHSLGPSSVVYVSEGNGGELVVSASGVKSRKAERKIDAGLNPVVLTRWIGLNYLYGTGTLRIYSESGFAPQQLDMIDQKLGDDCMGFELTSQSTNELVIEDFTDIKEMSLEKVILRLKFLMQQEFREISSGNTKTIKKIEGRVNRFYMLGVRYLNIMQPADYFRAINVLNMLELISDGITEAVSEPEKGDVEVFRMLEKQFALCFDALGGNEEAIAKTADFRAEIKKAIKKSKSGLLHTRLLADISNRITDISEYGFLPV